MSTSRKMIFRRALCAAAVVASLIGLAEPASATIVPDAPTNLALAGADGGLTATWTAPASDGGSTITRYTAQAYTAASGGSPVEGCSTFAATEVTCLISGLTSGTTYYVDVYATNADGAGSPSSPRISRVAGSLPSAPRSVTALRTAGGGVAVAWTAPSNNGGSDITGYTATAFTGSSASADVAATCTTTSLECSMSGLDAAATYYVSVRATNAIGSGSASSRVTVRSAGVPAAPESVRAPRGNGFSRVAWTAPATNGNSSITRYDVKAWTTPEGGSEVANCQPAKLSSLSCDLGPLPNGGTYYVDVFATNGFGAGPASTPRVAVTPATTPSAPRDVTATRVGGNVVVSWTVPATDGGLAITDYTATAYSSESGTATVASCTTLGASCTITGIKGAPVWLDVVARTPVGESPASTPRIKVRLLDRASTPMAVSGSPRPQGIAVSWRPPLNDGGRPVVSYTATAYSAPNGGVAVGTCTTAVTSANAKRAKAGVDDRLGCTIGGLTPRTVYYVDVAATTEFGPGAPSTRVAMGVRQGRPLPPRNVSGMPASHKITVSWDLPAADGGSPITDYRVQAWSKEQGGTLLSACDAADIVVRSDYSCVLDAKWDFEPYWVQVQARNAHGWSAPTSRQHFEANPAAPTAPGDVHVQPVAKGLLVDWDAPYGDGGYPIYTYIATAFDSATGGSRLGSCTVTVKPRTAKTATTPTECVITGLAPDAYAYVEVTAENTVGVSAPSGRVSSTATIVS